MTELNQEFWNNRYEQNETGWDVGEITTPLKEYVDQLEDKTVKILIPGAGNAHEAEYLHERGFSNVYIVDISPLAIENFKNRVPSFPEEHLICADFFAFEGQFDLILEQTFFCAIDPQLRQQYAEKTASLLKEDGKIAGLMFCFPLTEDGPPFGGSVEEYQNYFNSLFDIQIMENATNSIEPRAGRELFVKMKKR